MADQARVFGRHLAMEVLTPDDIGKVSGGWPCGTTDDTYCIFELDVEHNDDCGCDS